MNNNKNQGQNVVSLADRRKRTATKDPAGHGIVIAVPHYDDDEVCCGFVLEPVVAWLWEDHDGCPDVPLIQCDENTVMTPDDVYAVQHLDGSFFFPDGERCSEGDLIEAFRRRIQK
jgi:hypothetical protein